jgi:hypothetical protein
MKPLRTSVVMKTDIGGSTSRFRGLLAADLQTLLSNHLNFIAHHSAEHGGRIIKSAGDGYWLEFSSATGAARAAVEMQEALRLAQPRWVISRFRTATSSATPLRLRPVSRPLRRLTRFISQPLPGSLSHRRTCRLHWSTTLPSKGLTNKFRSIVSSSAIARVSLPTQLLCTQTSSVSAGFRIATRPLAPWNASWMLSIP